MNIVFLTTEFITEPNSFDGGLSNYLYKVSVSLLTFGHQPIVIVKSFEDKELEIEGIIVFRVKVKENLIYKIADKLTQFKYQMALDCLNISYALNRKAKELNKFKKINIIQYPSYQALGLFRPRKIISVMRISGFQQLADTANGLVYNTIRERQVQILEKWTYKNSKNIIGPSYFLAEIVQTIFGKKVTVIESPYSIKSLTFNYDIINKIKEITKDQPFLLHFGRLAMIKGTTDVVDMLKSFFKKYSNYFVVIIGKDVGYKGKPTLDYVYSNLEPFKDRIIYFKEQTHEMLIPVVKSSSIILMPSRIENFPNACVEAMSMCKVVVATKGVSFEQLITDKENGFLCEKSNPKDLLKVVEEVLNLPLEVKEKIELKAGETVKRLHPDNTVKNLIEYYQSVIKNS